jgi:predicted transcriptional regulator
MPETIKGKLRKQHHTILAMRQRGAKAKEIALHLGVSHWSISSYIAEAGIPRKPAKLVKVSKPCGQIPMRKAFTAEQLRELDDEANEIGAETLSEAAIEILRDYLDERAAKRQKIRAVK